MTSQATDQVGLASRIQHTLIKEGVTAEMMVAHCAEARRWGFDAVMVPGIWVALCKKELAGTEIKVASAVDFPFGAMSQRARLAEVEELVAAGVDEIDMAPSTGALLSGERDRYRVELSEFVTVAGDVAVKVMLELPLLGPDDARFAIESSVEAGVRYVKNSSSGVFGPARPQDIALLRESVPPEVGVKASGGISSVDLARRLLAAGADLLGSSAGTRLAAGEDAAKSY